MIRWGWLARFVYKSSILTTTRIVLLFRFRSNWPSLRCLFLLLLLIRLLTNERVLFLLTLAIHRIRWKLSTLLFRNLWILQRGENKIHWLILFILSFIDCLVCKALDHVDLSRELILLINDTILIFNKLIDSFTYLMHICTILLHEFSIFLLKVSQSNILHTLLDLTDLTILECKLLLELHLQALQLR